MAVHQAPFSFQAPHNMTKTTQRASALQIDRHAAAGQRVLAGVAKLCPSESQKLAGDLQSPLTPGCRAYPARPERPTGENEMNAHATVTERSAETWQFRLGEWITHRDQDMPPLFCSCVRQVLQKMAWHSAVTLACPPRSPRV